MRISHFAVLHLAVLHLFLTAGALVNAGQTYPPYPHPNDKPDTATSSSSPKPIIGGPHAQHTVIHAVQEYATDSGTPYPTPATPSTLVDSIVTPMATASSNPTSMSTSCPSDQKPCAASCIPTSAQCCTSEGYFCETGFCTLGGDNELCCCETVGCGCRGGDGGYGSVNEVTGAGAATTTSGGFGYGGRVFKTLGGVEETSTSSMENAAVGLGDGMGFEWELIWILVGVSAWVVGVFAVF